MTASLNFLSCALEENYISAIWKKYGQTVTWCGILFQGRSEVMIREMSYWKLILSRGRSTGRQQFTWNVFYDVSRCNKTRLKYDTTKRRHNGPDINIFCTGCSWLCRRQSNEFKNHVYFVGINSNQQRFCLSSSVRIRPKRERKHPIQRKHH